jgi:hypothetical protein
MLAGSEETNANLSHSWICAVPSYSDQSSQLWKLDIAVADAALTDRLGARGNTQGEVKWTSLKTLMAKEKAADWYTGEREELLAVLTGGSTGPPLQGGKSGPAGDPNRTDRCRSSSTGYGWRSWMGSWVR